MNPEQTERAYWLTLVFGTMLISFGFIIESGIIKPILAIGGVVAILVSIMGIKLARMSPDHSDEPYYVEGFSLVQNLSGWTYDDLQRIKNSNIKFMRQYPETIEALTRQNKDIETKLAELRSAWVIKR